MSLKFRFKTVGRWLMLCFLALGLLPVVVSSIVIYNQRVEVIRVHRLETLSAIRDLKVNQVENWINERLGDGRIISESPEILALSKELGQEDPIHADKRLEGMRSLLNRYLKGFNSYDELFVIDSKAGAVLVSTDSADEGKVKRDYPYFSATLEKKEIVLSDIYFSETLQKPSMVLSSPIFDHTESTKVIAILVARINLENTIYALLNDRTGMGATGETLLISKDGLALNELRWHKNAPLKLKITATPAVLAVQGNTGIIEIDDYRKVPVLAAYTHIPQLGWGFVAKQDVVEVFASIQSMLYNILIVVGSCAVFIVFCAYYIAQRITLPIQEMKEISNRLQSGDLAARNKTARADEFGFLARSINALADSIQMQVKVQTGSSEIIASLVSAEGLDSFADELLKKLMTHTDSRMAAFYLRDKGGQLFQPLASIGTNADSLKSFDATKLEGELGVALASRKIEHITAIPPDTRFTFNAVAGQALPREIITIPLLVKSEVIAIVSLANLKEYSEESLEILQRCWLPINTALASILASNKTQLLAEQLAEKNEELAAGNEELQSNSEELQAQAEELREQTDELKQTAAELEAQRAQVEDADRLKSEFLSNMSHELRTPLNSVLALSQLMISRGTGKNPAEEEKFLQVIERNGRQLLNLINDILDLSKIESGRMDIFSVEFEASQAVQRALDTIRPLAEEKSLKIEVNITDAPQMDSDEDKINQILLNLLSNAVKFTDQGSISVNVKTASQKVSFVVCDTGVGILVDDLEHIFDEFRQVDGSVTRRHEGTGLGLAICQKLAVLLGGRILVESTAGVGSTFILELPLKTPTSGDFQAKPLPAAKRAAKVDTQRTILIIDDERDVRELVGKHLEEAGYKVALAANGQEGMRLAKELNPYAITLDIFMPDRDGWEVLRSLKADPDTAEIPVVMLSASDDRATGMALGASGHLTKPVDKNVLIAEIKKVASGKAVRQILVVDDDPVARDYAQTVLEQNGYIVALAENGLTALRLLKESPPDLMLLDLMMPDISGFEVLDEMRKDLLCQDLPVIVLTAKDLSLEERSSLNNSAQNVLTKSSLSIELLIQEVVSALEQVETRGPKQPAAGKPLILVVEDNEIAALQVQSALQENGYAVTVAANGEEALASVKRVVPDGLVLDLMMPGIDGFQVLESIRSTPWTELLPVVVLTAKELTTQDRARLKNNHVKQLIQKGSINRAQLLAAVHSMVEVSVVTAEPVVQKQQKPAQEGRLTLLVVEDNADNMLTVLSVLEQEDYKIITAEDGIQAVEMAEQARPDLILMDMQLPKMSGWEATKRIKTNSGLAWIPIVALTANAMKGDREKMLDSGCVDYLAKPFDPIELQEMVRKWITG